MDTTIIYDGTFSGFLTVVFDCYKFKLHPEKITTDAVFQTLYSTIKIIVTDDKKSERVQKALKKKVSAKFYQVLVTGFLSERPGIELLLFQLIKKILISTHSIEHNLADKAVNEILQLNNQFHKEAHRMYAFIRFKKQEDNIYTANIEPSFNMIPYITPFFVDRFADQSWVIFDVKRKKGIYYDKESVSLIHSPVIKNNDAITDMLSHAVVNEEKSSEALWKTYFSSVNIQDRKNLKLQRSHMPKKYWKYLSELKP